MFLKQFNFMLFFIFLELHSLDCDSIISLPTLLLGLMLSIELMLKRFLFTN